jgi:hypothetical protein
MEMGLSDVGWIILAQLWLEWLGSCLFIKHLIYSLLFIYLRLKSSDSGALVNIELERMRAKVFQAQGNFLLHCFSKGAEENYNC